MSSKTVSRVYTNRELVSPETVDRVLSAAKRLRFRPNTLARTLRRGGATRTIGFVMGDLSNPFYYKVASGIEEELSRNGWLTVQADPEIIFSVPPEERFNAAIRLLGIDIAMLSGEAGHA